MKESHICVLALSVCVEHQLHDVVSQSKVMSIVDMIVTLAVLRGTLSRGYLNSLSVPNR